MNDQANPIWARRLLKDGYCIIPDLLTATLLADLEADLEEVFARTPFGHGDFYGYRTKRFGRLLRRSRIAAELVLEATVLSLAKQILSPACDQIQLNVAQAIEIHPGEIAQFPHCDHDMWAGVKGQHEYLLNVIWPLSRFTAHNGATRFYPATQGRQAQDRETSGDPIIATCDPGTAICFLGSTLHGAGANVTGSVRRAVIVGYSLGWLKPYENLWLSYPPQVARGFPAELAELAGYNIHRPNLGNYEGQCPSILLHDNVPSFPQATDALRPDQSSIVADFARNQRVKP